MTLQNLRWLLLASVVCVLCYERVGDARRDRTGRILLEALTDIEENYLEPIDRQTLFQGAMDGMLSRLDDYSAYIPPMGYERMQEDFDQQFTGIGIQVMVDQETGQLTVVTPVEGTPAYKAGVQAGDRILAINGRSTQGFTVEDAVKQLRGKEGDAVTLRLLHRDESDPVDVNIKRAVIQTETVVGDHRNPEGAWSFFLPGDDRIGYIRIPQMFSDRTASELQQALEGLVKNGMRGLILDVRGNPGGLLEAAVKTCDLFIDEGKIVSTRGRGGVPVKTYEAERKGTFRGFPMAVLVDRDSASASEIVAACLQDHKRAVVVGERTFGKGSVQNIIPLEGDKSALKLTTSSYWRPSGTNIHRTSTAKDDDPWGVRPDPGLEVKLSDEEREKLGRWFLSQEIISAKKAGGVKASGETDASAAEPATQRAPDPQRERAIQYLNEAIQTDTASKNSKGG